MKLSSLLLLFMLPFLSAAQFTLDSSNFPTVGETNTYIVQLTGLDVENDGPDQTWNMGFVSGGQDAEIDYVGIADLPGSDTFPTADFAEVSGGYITYMDQTENGVNIVGIDINEQVTVNYSNPLKYLEFPFSYEDTYIDDYFADIVINGTEQTAVDFGTFEETYDGYGSLILPYGTLENTARLKTVNTLTEIFEGDTIHAVTTAYYWFSEDFAGLVALYAEVEQEGQPTQRVVNIITESDYNNIEEIQSTRVTIYPNPSSDRIRVQTEVNILDYELVNLQGKTVLKEKLAFDKTISVLGLPSGTYLLKLHMSKGRTTKKIVIE